ncbi:MAG: hypothetical protein AAGA75_18200 [Cyanobacteria bacterium P01_E01_bin.6]
MTLRLRYKQICYRSWRTFVQFSGVLIKNPQGTLTYFTIGFSTTLDFALSKGYITGDRPLLSIY